MTKPERALHITPHAADSAWKVLQSLRVKGMADAAVLARGIGLDVPTVQVILGQLRADGLAERDPRHGWRLTGSGRGMHMKLLANELSAPACRPCREALHASYERFVELNPQLLEVVTAWQVRAVGVSHVPNDHIDRTYDGGVLRRLGLVHSLVRAICHDLTGVLDRFSPYEGRLSEALSRCRHGEGEWLDQPLIDSYHTAWFELHEDLLLTTGIPRTA